MIQDAPGAAWVIVNPQAGGGRARRAAGAVVETLRRGGVSVQSRVTTGPGHAAELAAAAVAAGATALLTLGGDGTLNETVAGVLRLGAWPAHLRLAPLPLGTGNAFGRDFGLVTGGWRAAVQRLLEGHVRWVDAARVTYTLPSAVPRSPLPALPGEYRFVDERRGGNEAQAVNAHYFVNMFGAGIAARVANTTNRRFKYLGGLGYSAATLWELAGLHAPVTRLELSGPEGDMTIEAPLTMVAVCNTQWTGETMWIAPQANAADGLLDVLTLGAVRRVELLQLFGRIFRGTHIGHPAVAAYRARRARVTPVVPGPLLMDGEVFGQTPATIEILPGAVQIAL